MKASYLSFAFLGLALALVVSNLLHGWNLSQSNPAEADPQLHLFFAFLCLGALALAFFYFVRTSKRELNKVQARILESGHENETAKLVLRLERFRMNALQSGAISIALCILGMITGTVSQAGKLPWLHTLLALGVLITGSQCFWRQYHFFQFVQKITKPASA